MTYRTTTSYGTWCNQINDFETSPEQGLNSYLGDQDPDEYDMDSIHLAYRRAIDDALPPSVSLCGDEFIGPAHIDDGEFDGYPTDEFGGLDLRAIVEDVDFDPAEAFERYELYTLEHIGKWVLDSKAKDPAKAAAAAVSKLGLKAFAYRPHPDSGRAQAWYRAGDVKDALAARPGRGTRTDINNETA
ncbi:hypothetical protein [Streptomyces sp. NBC_01565]|uniref:hypothetical protein n=1 Tax=Streptomyces sp. NBC_01565 TaxID=2975881 RepID=UPI00224C85F3|nr:hypothetical protein [Streptomyces sp. NBC_01565]MCX4543753.1 hypothetical protein [Streptomyces sp. NBC_01565]